MNDDFDSEKNDEFCKSLIEREGNEDLFEWLSKKDDIERTLGEMSTQVESVDFAAELSLAGAVKVWAIDIERASEEVRLENTGKLCVMLPKEESKRENLLEIGNGVASEQGYDAVPDKGQDYLFISLD